MIWGIGVDTTDISRIQKSMERPHFIRRVFGPGEQTLFAGQKGNKIHQTAAGCFAAKEAFLKACGKGLGGFSLTEIQALRKENGRPYLAFVGEALEYMQQNGLHAHLSITNEKGLATAFVVLEATSGNPPVTPI